jgi:SAM-dependent methyltransferase
VSGRPPRVPQSPQAKEQTHRDRDRDEQDEPPIRGVIERARGRFPASYFQTEHPNEHAGNETDKRVTECIWHPGVSKCSYPKKERGRGQERKHIDRCDPPTRWAPRSSEPETDDEQERRSCHEGENQKQHTEDRNERHPAILHSIAEGAMGIVVAAVDDRRSFNEERGLAEVVDRRNMTQTNSYSRSWFEFFHVPIGEERTEKEVEFICQCAPLPAFGRILDVCCGMGRHARALADRGYSVTGVERDPGAVAKARALGGSINYVQADIKDYEPDGGAYDLAIVMSQSFGYYDATANRELLARLANGVRTGGRVILDLWNPEFFTAHPGARNLETPIGPVEERKRVEDGRLLVHLTYPKGADDDFEWQLFGPAEMKSLGESAGLTLMTACTNFDATEKPNAANPRIQFVLQKS